MAAIALHTVIDTAEIDALLDRLVKAGTDLTPAMRDVAGVLRDASQDAFDDEADPSTGDPWQELKPKTVTRRGSTNPILQVSGDLARIQTDYGVDYAAAVSPEIHAATHQFGDDERGIPARPYLGIDKEDEQDILDILRRHLTG